MIHNNCACTKVRSQNGAKEPKISNVIRARKVVKINLKAVVNLNHKSSTKLFPNTVDEPKAKAAMKA